MRAAANLFRSLNRFRTMIPRPTNYLHPIPQRLSTQHRHASRFVQRSRLSQRVRDYSSRTWQEPKKKQPTYVRIMFILVPTSIVLVGGLLYYDYKTDHPPSESYPAPVEEQLRLALHYTHVKPDPLTAAKHFAQAIRAAEDCEMDPFSKEFMGIRIRYAQMLEQHGHADAAVLLLTDIAGECEKKLQEIDNGQEGASNQVDAVPVPRSTLLRGIIESRVKVASLIEGEYIQDPTQAKEVLSDVISLLVKETRDPQTNGFTEDNAAGISMAEIASLLSQMGDLYATTGEEANAVQVYMLTLQPLRVACNGTRSCKEVQVLSNIASTMTLAMKKPNAKINGKPLTKASLAAARRATLKWADQAIATADLVSPESRDDICALGLLSAQMTRADLLLDSGEKEEAKQTFISLLPTLREKGLDTLSKVAEQGLKRASL